MWLVSTFEKNYLRKIFFVSTFLDWYNPLEKWKKKRNILLIFLRKNGTLYTVYIRNYEVKKC